MTDHNDKKPFWNTIYDNLKPILGLITALIMLYAAWVGLHNDGLHNDEPTPIPSPAPTKFNTDPMLTPTSKPTSPQSVTVQGTVTDENNMPVGNLKVSLNGSSDITGMMVCTSYGLFLLVLVS